MKRMYRGLALVLAGSMLFTSFPVTAFAQGVQEMATPETADLSAGPLVWEDYQYTLLEDGTVSICGYTGTAEEDALLVAEVPEEIAGSPVTEIAREAFANQPELDAVLLPDSVVSVDNAAFYQCEDLKILAFCGALPAFGITLAEGCPALQTVLLLQDQDTEFLENVLARDLGEERAAAVELRGYEREADLTDGWQAATEQAAEAAAAPAADGQPRETADAAVQSLSARAANSCGENLTWDLSDDGTLTISGTGAMNGYPNRDAPWEVYSNRIRRLVLEEGITSIGSYAFYDLSGLSEPVTFPQSLESIGEAAFAFCENMPGDLILPHGISKIGSKAFQNCSALDGVLSLPRNLGVLEEQVFYKCSGLTGALELPRNLVEIGKNALYECSGFTGELTIPDSVETIGSGAFYRMSGITGITLGSGLRTFAGDLYPLAPMGRMTALQQVTFTAAAPPTVENTGLFADCDQLTRVTVPAAAYKDYMQVLSGLLPAGVRLAADGETGDFLVQDHVLIAYLGNDAVVEVPADVTAIGTGAFGNNETLTRVVLPESVTSIGTRAFQNCTALAEVTAPAKLTGIGDFAFEGCTALTTLDLPETVCRIGEAAFSGCAAWRTQLGLPVLEELGARAFYGCAALTGAELGDPLTEIGEAAFRDCSGLTRLVLPQNLQRIGKEAFYGCGLTGDLTIPATVSEIGDRAFYACRALEGTLSIGAGTRSIGASAFYGDWGLTELQLAEGVVTIGDSAFGGCSGLSGSLVLPDSITTLGERAFSGCSGLNGTLHLPASLTSLGIYCFEGCGGITGTLRIPDGVTYLPEGAFASMQGLTELVVGTGLESWYSSSTSRENPFYGTSIETVTLLGSHPIYASFFDRLHPDTIYLPAAQYAALIENCRDFLYIYSVDVRPLDGQGDFAVLDGVLVAYAGTETRVTVPDGVTAIGPYAFYNRTDVVSVTLPDGVTAIGQGAFYRCDGLAAVELPQSLAVVEEDAFWRCRALSGDLVLPDAVTRVGMRAFCSCSSLTGLQLPAQLQTLEQSAFSGCTGLTGTLTIPEGVTSIPSSAFSGCSGLTGLVLGPAVTAIGDSAFSDCTGLTGTLTLPDTLLSLGSSAFRNCAALTGALTLPAGLQTLGTDTFAGCTGLTGTLVLPDGVAALPLRVFAGMTGITELQCGTGLTRIDVSGKNTDSPLYGMTGLTEITFPGETPPTQSKSGDFLGSLTALRRIYVPEASLSAYSQWLQNNLPDGVRLLAIGASSDFQIVDGVLLAYLGQEEEVTVPEEVTSLGKGAFLNCDTVTRVTLPEGLVDIGESAFENCTGLTSVVFPSTLQQIGDRAFYGCTALQAADLPDSLTAMGSYAFYHCESLAEVDLPAGLGSLPDHVFAGSGLTSVTLPESLTNLGASAFEDCTALSGTLTLPESLADLGASAFEDCAALSGTLTLPDALTSLRGSVFRGCAGLTGLVLPAELTSIGGNAFYGCSGLSGELRIPDTVTSIQNYAFYACSGFTGTLVLPDGLTTLGTGAFDGCSGFTGTLKVPDGITTLPNVVFAGMSKITALEFGTGLTDFAELRVDSNHPLQGMSAVTSLTFHGQTVPGWEDSTGRDVTIFTPLTALASVRVPAKAYTEYKRSFAASLPAGAALEIEDAAPGEELFIRDGVLCAYLGTDPAVDVPYGVTAIADNAFRDNTTLTSITLPDTLTAIGDYAFYGCTALEGISLPRTLADLGSYAFYGCTGLRGDLTLPAALTEIGNYAFAGCTGLDGTLVVEPAERKSLGQYTFSDCTSLTGLQLGEGLQTLEASTFLRCGSLCGTLDLPQSLTGIGSSAFRGCSSLSGTLHLPEQLTSLGSYAFAGCTGFTGELMLPDGVRTLQTGVFSEMTGVVSLVFGAGLTTFADASQDSSQPLYGMSAVTEVSFLGTAVPGQGSRNPLASLTALQTVYVPAESLEAYRAAFATGLPSGAEFSSDLLRARVSNLAAQRSYSKTVVLRWDPHRSEQVTRYVVERDGAPLGQTEDCTFTDSGLTPGTEYTYRVYGQTEDGRTTGAATLQVTPREPQILEITVANGTDRVNLDNTLQILVQDTGNLDPLGDRETVGQLYYLDGEEPVLIGTAVRDDEISASGTALYTIHWDITDLPDGAFTLRFTLTDADGATAECTRTVTLDHSVPKSILGFSAVADSALIHLSWLVAEEADTIGYHIYRREEDEDRFTLLATLNNRFALEYYDGRIDENTLYYYYIVGVSVLQQEGEPSDLIGASLVPDTEAPVITALTPADGSRLKGTVSFALQAKDNFAVTRSRLEYAVGEPAEEPGGEESGETTEEPVWTLLHESAGNRCTGELDTETLPDGPLQVRALAWDAAGNESEPLTALYTIRNGGPAAVTGLSGESTVTTITLRWDEPEESVALFRVEQKQPDGSFAAVQEVRGVLGANLYGFAPDTGYTFRVVCQDADGTRGEPSEEVTVRTQADTEAPVISSLRPAPGYYRDSIEVRATATDTWDVQSITVQVSADKMTWTDFCTETYEDPARTRTLACTLPLDTYREGWLWVRAIAADSAGNRSSDGDDAPFVQYYIDRTAPAAPQSVMAADQGGSILVSWEQGIESDLRTYSIYRSEEADGPFTLVQEGVEELSWLDRTVEANKTYYYQVVANDAAGNHSEFSASVSAAAEPDREAPEVVSFAPASGSSRGPQKPNISLLVRDNRSLARVEVEYGHDGEHYEPLKDWQDLDDVSCTLGLRYPAEEFSHGDTLYLRARAADQAGNVSEWALAQYAVDTTAPVLTEGSAAYTEAGVVLQWTGEPAEDLDAYRIYRCRDDDGEYSLLKELAPDAGSYTDTNLALQETTYTYQVEAVDAAGNTSRLDLGTVQTPNRSAPTPKLSCDSVMEVGVEYIFDATLSRDDKEITAYSIDFGDDTTASQAVAVHAYHQTGDYTVTLTVTNSDGLESTLTRQIHVKERAFVGHALIRVVDESGTPLIDAPVYFDMGEEEQVIRLTDARGQVTFDGDVGLHTVGCLIADNQWLPAKQEIELLAGQQTEATITLVKQALVEGNFEVDRMTYEEIVNAGIDVTRPENQCILKVTVHLVYGDNSVEHSFHYNTSTGETDSKPIFVQANGTVHELIARPLCGSQIPVRDDDDADDPGSGGTPDYIFSHEVSIAYLDIPVGAYALKDMFDVRLHILNNASADFPLLDNEVQLNLPEGLTLMEAYDSESQAHVSIGEIPGRSTETIRWILRGDELGSYDLSADYSGVLAGFNVPFQAHFVSSEPLQVYGLSGLELLIEIADELDNGAFYYNVSMINSGRVDLYGPRIATNSSLIESEVYNASGEDVTDSMQWMVDQSASDFEPVPDVSEAIRVLPAGYRLTQHYMELDQTRYSTLEQELSDYAARFKNSYGAKVTIRTQPLSYFLESLSVEVDTMDKAEQTLTDSGNALAYLMDNDQYVYWSLYKSTGAIAGMMPTDSQRGLWNFLGVVNGENTFSEFLKGADPEAVKAILLQAMELSVASNENSQYTFISDFFGGLNSWINSDVGGNEGLLAISNMLENKAVGWTDSLINKASGTMTSSMKKAVSNIFQDKRWSVYKSIFEKGSENLSKVVWDEVRAVLKGEDPDLYARLEELKLSDEDVWDLIQSMLSSESADETWNKIGFTSKIKDLLLNQSEANPEEMALYMAARSSLNTYILYLDTIIDYCDTGSQDGRALVSCAKEIRAILVNEGNTNEEFWTSLINSAKQMVVDLVDEGVSKIISSVIGTKAKIALGIGRFIDNELFNTGEQHEISNNIRYIACMSEAMRAGLSAAKTAYLNDKNEDTAGTYMEMIYNLLNLRELGEQQVAALGMAMEIVLGHYDSEEFLHAASSISGQPGSISWLGWRGFVEKRISLVRMQLLRSPINQDSASLTAPTVTFDYSKGQTVQSFSDHYEYSLDDGAVWTRCTGTPIAVAQSFNRTELLVRSVEPGTSGESLTARVTIYPPASLANLRVLQTETGYRVEGLDRDRTYQVTFSETARDYSYGDSLELNVPAGSSAFDYATEQTLEYVYVRAVTDDLHYATYVSAPPVYPMVNISVDHTGSGTVAGSGRYEYGTTVTLYPTTASQVYTFAGWYEDGYLISNQPTLTLQAETDRRITARFDKIITSWQADTQTARAVGIPAGTSAQDVIDYFTDAEQGITARLTTADGRDTDTLATGNILYLNEEPCYVVSLGDVNGDAVVDQEDLQVMVDYLNRTRLLSGVYLEASLFCRNDDMDLFDIYRALDAISEQEPPQEGAAA